MERITLLCLLSSWFGASSAQQIKNVNVPEGDDALLPCGLSSQQRIDEFDWRKDNGEDEKMEVFEYERGSYYGNGRQGQNEQFKNRVEFFQHEVKSGNASIMIKDTQLTDNGTYVCGLGLRKEHRQEFIIRLNVGAARMPYIQTIHAKNSWTLLECKAQGIPKPDVKWINSAEEELEKHPESNNGPSYVNVKLNVTRSDNYTCVVTQQAICHAINNTIEVFIQELPTGMIVSLPILISIIISVLVAGIIIGLLIVTLSQRQRCGSKGHRPVLGHENNS